MAIAIWVVSALLAALFAFAGGSKLVQGVGEAVVHFGYPVWFMYFIGVCEIAGAVGLLIPRLSALAATGLGLIMIGAFGSHLMAGDPAANWAVPLVALALCAFVAIGGRSRRAAADLPAT